MAVQDPMKTINKEAEWLDAAYSSGCQKKQMIRRPTAVERQNGQRESVICEVIHRDDMVGQFFDAHGKPVPDAVAEAAGFDVRAARREQEKARRLAEAKARIEAEYEAEADEIEKETGDAAYEITLEPTPGA